VLRFWVNLLHFNATGLKFFITYWCCVNSQSAFPRYMKTSWGKNCHSRR